MKTKNIKVELTSLEGAPSEIKYAKNLITSLEGAPSEIGYGEVTFDKFKGDNGTTDNYHRTMSDYISLATIDGAGSDIF